MSTETAHTWTRTAPTDAGPYWFWDGIAGHPPELVAVGAAVPADRAGWWSPARPPELPRTANEHRGKGPDPWLERLRQVVRRKLAFTGPHIQAWLTPDTLWVAAQQLDHQLRQVGLVLPATHRLPPWVRGNSCVLRSSAHSAYFEWLLAIEPEVIWAPGEERPVFWRCVVPRNKHLTLVESATGIPSRYLKGPRIAVLLPEHYMLQALLEGAPCRSTPHAVIATYPDEEDFRTTSASRHGR